MAARARRRAGELEAEALAVLWATDRALTPAQVREQLGGGLAYTTVMTVLTRLHDKGLVAREVRGRGYVYTPVVEQAELTAERMRALLDTGHDRSAVLARFVGALSASDRRALVGLLERAGRRRR
jgi:predicted transcriptional regulator